MSLPDTPDRFIALGKLIAADIFVNNNDRFPALHVRDSEHLGNPRNLIFQIVLDDKCTNEDQYREPEYNELNFEGSCVAIDNKCFAIQIQDKTKKDIIIPYLNDVRDFLQSIFRDLKKLEHGDAPITEFDYPSLTKLRHFLFEQTNYTIQGRECLKVLEGLVIGFYNLVNVGLDTAYDLLDQLQVGGPLVHKDHRLGVWAHGLKELDIEYFKLAHAEIE
jgi:hypothetical protein